MANETGDGVKRRGFASMDPERRRELAAKGGRAVDPDKRLWRQDPDAAAKAGRWKRPKRKGKTK